MRFITEFELSEREINGAVDHLYYRKRENQEMMGAMLNVFWRSPINGNPNRHRLEIETFPMDKWIEFKSKLFSKFIDDDYENADKILELIKELEFCGTPSTK